MDKILVALPKDIVTLIDDELVGKLGEGRSDTIRAIILSWLDKEGYFAKGGKNAKE
jgi:metal-responsive CopG/Arc/MetJ family transcriptional regulator